MALTSNFAYHVLKKLQERTDNVILVIEGQSVTRKKLHEKVTASINLLKWKGLVPNDRVLMTIEPSVDFYAAVIAILAIGGSIVIIDGSMGLEKCDHCIATAKSSMWLWNRGSKLRFLKYILPALRHIPIHLELGDLELPCTQGELFSHLEVEPVDHALVTFTTGSTGMPKLLLRKHSFLLNQTHSLSMAYDLLVKEELGLEEEDAVYSTNLPVFPLHFLKVGSLCLLFPNIDKGRPSEIIKTLKKYKCMAMTASPAFVEKLAVYAQKHDITFPSQYVGLGGAPVFKNVLQTVCSVLPTNKTAVVYGSTEAEPISVIFANEKMELESSVQEGMCVGKPVFEGSVKVIQIMEGPITGPVNLAVDYELPAGQIGELVLSGWHVNTYQVESKRLVTDMDGTVWLRIEDAGYQDDKGRLWLVGRVKWMVERKGRRFWSTVVEQKLMDRCSLISFAVYLNHEGEAWLFLEAPKGLPNKEEAGIKSFLRRENIPTDHIKILRHIPKDKRHRSKPDTTALFKRGNPNSPFKVIKFVLRSNPFMSVFILFVQILLIMCAIVVIINL